MDNDPFGILDALNYRQLQNMKIPFFGGGEMGPCWDPRTQAHWSIALWKKLSFKSRNFTKYVLKCKLMTIDNASHYIA